MHFLESAGEQFGKVPWGQLSLAVWLLVALALVFDFLNGFHDSANSVATVVSTRVLSPQAAVVCLTASAGRREIAALLEAGATACLRKDQELEEIVDAIKRAAESAAWT